MLQPISTGISLQEPLPGLPDYTVIPVRDETSGWWSIYDTRSLAAEDGHDDHDAPHEVSNHNPLDELLVKDNDGSYFQMLGHKDQYTKYMEARQKIMTLNKNLSVMKDHLRHIHNPECKNTKNEKFVAAIKV